MLTTLSLPVLRRSVLKSFSSPRKLTTGSLSGAYSSKSPTTSPDSSSPRRTMVVYVPGMKQFICAAMLYERIDWCFEPRGLQTMLLDVEGAKSK